MGCHSSCTPLRVPGKEAVSCTALPPLPVTDSTALILACPWSPLTFRGCPKVWTTQLQQGISAGASQEDLTNLASQLLHVYKLLQGCLRLSQLIQRTRKTNRPSNSTFKPKLLFQACRGVPKPLTLKCFIAWRFPFLAGHVDSFPSRRCSWLTSLDLRGVFPPSPNPFFKSIPTQSPSHVSIYFQAIHALCLQVIVVSPEIRAFSRVLFEALQSPKKTTSVKTLLHSVSRCLRLVFALLEHDEFLALFQWPIQRLSPHPNIQVPPMCPLICCTWVLTKVLVHVRLLLCTWVVAVIPYFADLLKKAPSRGDNLSSF